MKTYFYLLTMTMLGCICSNLSYAQSIHYDSTMSDYIISNPVPKSAPVDKIPEGRKQAVVIPGSGTVFKPCSTCTNIYPEKYTTDVNGNLGFEKGNLSNWTFYIGSNEDWYAPIGTYPGEARFECVNYYTEDMLPSGGVWTAGQLNYIHKRVQRIDKSKLTPYFDPIGGYPGIPPLPNGQIDPDNKHVVRLGGYQLYGDPVAAPTNSSPAEMAVKKVIVTKTDPYITYKYALTLAASHGVADATYFRIQVFNQNCEEIPCLGLFIDSSSDIPGVSVSSDGQCKYKKWTNKTIDLSQYFVDAVAHSEEVFTLAFSVSNCKYGGHYGYAYIDLEAASGIRTDGILCTGSKVNFSGPFGNSWGETALWKLYKYNGSTYDPVDLTGITTNQQNFSYFFTIAGNYRSELTLTDGSCSTVMRSDFTIEDCTADVLTCEDCIKSFAPIPGQKYVLSAWVKEDFIVGTSSISYANAKIGVSFTGPGSYPTYTFSPTGPIIDGWQKVEEEFIIPGTANYINIDLKGSPATDAYVYFDDIRVFPFKADMRSFVYDPTTQKLMAELDENNYATFYEYDEEGKLRRVKKETERGVMTIKESGGNTHNK